MSKTKKLLLRQHIGAPCEPCVKRGDEVKSGTLIAKPSGLGANIYSSVDGKVDKVTKEFILMKQNKEFKTGTDQKYKKIKYKKDDILDAVRAAGLVGLGGAGFPTAIKLDAKLKDGYVLVNAAECEPLIEHNMAQIRDYPEKTISGIKYCMKASGATKAVIAIKEKHKEEIEILNKHTDGKEISIHLLPDLYPSGEERAIIRDVLGILLEPTQLPLEANCVVANIETVYRVAQAVEDKRPLITKNITVAGKLKTGTNSKVLYDVPIGTSVGEIIEMVGGIDGEYGEIILGGPFTGKAVDLDTPILKMSGAILVTDKFENLKGTKLGLLLCACGGNEERMQDLAKKYNGKVVCVQKCKQAADVKGTLKCENPGNCPGQALKCLTFKKEGCTDILIGNCSDCTNTVMASAPQLGLEVHHQTDHVLKTCGLEPIRQLKNSKKTQEQLQSEEKSVNIKEADDSVKNTVPQTLIDENISISFDEIKNLDIELIF